MKKFILTGLTLIALNCDILNLEEKLRETIILKPGEQKSFALETYKGIANYNLKLNIIFINHDDDNKSNAEVIINNRLFSLIKDDEERINFAGGYLNLISINGAYTEDILDDLLTLELWECKYCN